MHRSEQLCELVDDFLLLRRSHRGPRGRSHRRTLYKSLSTDGAVGGAKDRMRNPNPAPLPAQHRPELVQNLGLGAGLSPVVRRQRGTNDEIAQALLGVVSPRVRIYDVAEHDHGVVHSRCRHTFIGEAQMRPCLRDEALGECRAFAEAWRRHQRTVSPRGALLSSRTPSEVTTTMSSSRAPQEPRE